MLGKFGHKITQAVKKDCPIKIDFLDTPYSTNPELKEVISRRGL
jgi:N-acetylneuraminate synthase